MSFRLIVLKSKHRRQVRKTNQGLRAHQAKLARIREKEEEDVSDFVLTMTRQEFMDYMIRRRGCC